MRTPSRRATRPSALTSVAGALLLSIIACADTSAKQGKPAEPTDVVAEIGDRKITLAEVDGRALTLDAARFGGSALRQAIYDARRQTLDDLIAEQLLESAAKARGITRDALVAQDVTSKLVPVTDADIQAWYNQNAARVNGATLDQVKEPIRQLLTSERRQAAMKTLVDELRSKATVRLALQPPRQDVPFSAQDPAKGPADAPVQIIEFSDFECPFCGRVTPTLVQISKTYGDRVRFIYRDFPLPIHPHALKAAEAAQCAHAQNKFWDYHDKLFANQQALAPEQLKKYAADLGLDAEKFNACVDQSGTAAAVQQDMKEAEAAGVSSTPYFFINGRVIAGSKPYDEFKQIIDEELQLKGASTKP